MTRAAAPRRVLTAVLASACVLAAAVYGVSQQASASQTDAPAPAAAPAASTPPAGATAQATPGGTPAPTPAPARPTVGTTGGPSAAPSTSPSAGPSSSPAQPVLNPTELPDSTRQQWKPMGGAKSLPLSGDFQLNECVTVQKATGWKQQGFLGSSRETIAVQDTLTFPDEATAASAYREIAKAMENCQATSRALQQQNALPQDATVRKTAATDAGAAWQRRWTGVQGLSSPGDQANHVYAVQRGSVLALLHFDEVASPGTAPSYDFRGDATVLRTLGTQLDK